MSSADQSDLLPFDAIEMLAKSGWYPGRIVPTSSFIPDGFVPFPKAESVLWEFGGLHIGLCGPGVDFARGVVEMDPRLAVHLKAELDDYERSLGRRLFPLGEAYRGDLYFIIDESGWTYLLYDELAHVGNPLADSTPNNARRKLVVARLAL